MVDENENLILALFSQVLEFEIDKIPEGKNKTADFIASDGKLQYLIELKTRRRSSEDIAERQDQFDSQGFAESAKRIERGSDFSKLLSDAVNQIESTAEHSSALKIVVFLLRDFDTEERWERIVTGIYGIRNIVDIGAEPRLQKCYYFSESDFYRYRNRLDGVILIDFSRRQEQLCLNDHSPNYGTLKSSALAKKFDGGTIDPRELERQGKIYIADGEVDRANEHTALRYLRSKYDLSSRAMTMGLGHYSASAIVPEEIE